MSTCSIGSIIASGLAQRRRYALSFLFSALLMGLWMPGIAQSDTLILTDTTNEPLAGAVVQVFAQGSATPQDFLVADGHGVACCVKANTLDSVLITVFGSAPVALARADLRAENRRLYGVVTPSSLILPEATISTSRFSGVIVNGDTLEFKADYFADGRETSLRHLIAQMPGLAVDDGGTVTYSGQKVERILIDGQDIVRSQFDFLNDVMLPTDLLNAQVILGRDAEGRSTITLNLNSKSQAQWRTGAEAAFTARSQPVLKANALRVNPGAWQGFGRGAFATNGEQPGEGISGLRAIDFEIEGKLSSVFLSRNRDQVYEFGNVDDDATDKRYGFGELHGARVKGASDTRAYLSFLETTTTSSSSESLFSTLDGRLLGERRSTGGHFSPRLTGNFTHIDSLNSRIAILVHARGSMGGRTLDESGSSTLGGGSGNFAFRDRDSRTSALGFTQLAFLLRDSLALQASTQVKASHSSREVDLADEQPIFGDSSALSGTGPHFVSRFGIDRRLSTQAHDLRLVVKAGAFKFVPFVQFETQLWREYVMERQSYPLFDPAEFYQAQHVSSGAVQTNYRRGRIYAQADLGVQQLSSGFRDGLRQNLWAPLFDAYAGLKLAKGGDLSLGGNFQTASFDPDEYWQTAIPSSTRTLAAGFGQNLRFSRDASVYADYHVFRSAGGASVFTRAQYGTREFAVERRLRPIDNYLVEEVVIADDAQMAAGSFFWSKPLQQRFSININGSSDLLTYRISDLAGQSQRIDSGRLDLGIGFRAEWIRWLHTYAKVGRNETRQWSDGAHALPSLVAYSTRLSLELRRERLNVKPHFDLRFGERVPTLGIYNFDVTYTFSGSGFQATLIGYDLGNYDRSGFRRVTNTAIYVRDEEYGRLPGYVKLGLIYKGKQAGARG